MSLSAGTRLGAYDVLALIGAGGMGEVYKARDTKLGRDVALKILPPTFTTDPERLARFRREAQVLAALNHPHIGAIYGLEEAPSTSSTSSGQTGSGQAATQFLVLELVDGETLQEKLAQVSTLKSQGTGLPIDEALAIARQIAEALEAAHEKGIIHRDLKPANIALTKDGETSLMWVDRKGAQQLARAARAPYLNAALSPDGSKAALEIASPSSDIWVYDLDRETLSRLTFDGVNGSPAWTPDGKRVTYRSQKANDPASNVYWKPADGSGPEERLTTEKMGQHMPNSWSGDGRVLTIEPTGGGLEFLTWIPSRRCTRCSSRHGTRTRRGFRGTANGSRTRQQKQA